MDVSWGSWGSGGSLTGVGFLLSGGFELAIAVEAGGAGNRRTLEFSLPSPPDIAGLSKTYTCQGGGAVGPRVGDRRKGTPTEGGRK